jgi:signal transduction histidine kinase
VSSGTSLERGIARRFALTLLLLYGTVAGAVWLTSARARRDFAALTLKNEAEALAAYVAASGRLDAPELQAAEEEPMRIWLRVRGGGELLAATPGAPALPVSSEDLTEEVVTIEVSEAGGRYLLVAHAVGGRARRLGSGLVAEAIGSLDRVVAAERRLGLILGLVGLVVIPGAALGGRLLARRALAPIAGLVAAIRAIDPEQPHRRLGPRHPAVEEVAILADAFDDLLERLAASLEAMRRFTADASHEIRNPLSVLRTGIEVTLRRERAPEEYRRLLTENLQEIVHLQAVLEGLLALARAEPGAEPRLTRSEVQLDRLVDEAVERLAPASHERGLTIVSRVDEGAVVSADEQLVRLVLFNLLDNAIKHGTPDGPVRVEVERTAAEARIRVANSGPAIPPEQRARLFDRYYRGSGGGTGIGGLGLSVVRWAAAAHGGSVELLDDGAEGVCFEVRLPAA